MGARAIGQIPTYWQADSTDVALVQVGDEGQERFIRGAAGPLLEGLRAAAPSS